MSNAKRTSDDGVIRITEPHSVVEISAPMAVVKLTGPAMVIEFTPGVSSLMSAAWDMAEALKRIKKRCQGEKIPYWKDDWQNHPLAEINHGHS